MLKSDGSNRRLAIAIRAMMVLSAISSTIFKEARADLVANTFDFAHPTLDTFVFGGFWSLLAIAFGIWIVRRGKKKGLATATDTDGNKKIDAKPSAQQEEKTKR